MKVPIKCPVCGDPLLTEFLMRSSTTNELIKSCTRRLSHHIQFAVHGENVFRLSIRITLDLSADWVFDKNNGQGLKIEIWKDKKNIKNAASIAATFPYFEPDFSNYKKLIAKIKTYLLFS